MKNIRLVAIDLDDTLLTTEKTINDKDLEAIKKARDMGVHIVFASGRHLDGVKNVLRGIKNTDYCITSAGAVVTDKDGKLVYSKCLSAETVHEILSYIASLNMYAQVYPPLSQFLFPVRCGYTDEYEKK